MTIEKLLDQLIANNEMGAVVILKANAGYSAVRLPKGLYAEKLLLTLYHNSNTVQRAIEKLVASPEKIEP